MNILDAIRSRKVFGGLKPFKKLETWANWIVALKAIFALPMDAAELEVFRKFTGRQDPPAEPFSEAFLIIGRRGGKGLISALICVFLAVFKEWNIGLGQGHIVCLATDRQQPGERIPSTIRRGAGIHDDTANACAAVVASISRPGLQVFSLRTAGETRRPAFDISSRLIRGL